MLTVLTPPVHTRLASLEAVKAELGLTGTEHDVRLARWLDQVSALIVGETHRGALALATYQETLAGQGGRRLMLSRTPLVAVTEVRYDGAPITDWSIADAAAGLLDRPAGWGWSPDLAAGVASRIPLPGTEAPRVTVTYQAGWTVPDDGDGYTLPRDLELACLDAIKAAWAAKDRDPRVQSETLGDYAYTLRGDDVVRLPGDVRRVLERYRRVI